MYILHVINQIVVVISEVTFDLKDFATWLATIVSCCLKCYRKQVALPLTCFADPHMTCVWCTSSHLQSRADSPHCSMIHWFALACLACYCWVGNVVDFRVGKGNLTICSTLFHLFINIDRRTLIIECSVSPSPSLPDQKLKAKPTGHKNRRPTQHRNQGRHRSFASRQGYGIASVAAPRR